MAGTPVWPPTIPRGTSIPKPSRLERKRQKLQERRDRRKGESDNKKEAKQRDSWRCRFPLCECHRQGLALNASHWKHHKGAGGDPQSLRSNVEDLSTVCYGRHKGSVIAIDNGTLQVRPLIAAKGANGPVAWWMDANAYLFGLSNRPAQWVELAREEAIGKLAPLNIQQIEMLHGLARFAA